jgi:hypothetical protein
MTDDLGQVGAALWGAIAEGRWDEARAMIHEDAVQEWPQSGERIAGRENILEINRQFPGGGPKISVRRTRAREGLAIMETDLAYPDGSVYQGITVMEFEDGKLRREVDYFAQPFPAPQWRAQWVERT